jgi:phosphotriesterase-related protein
MVRRGYADRIMLSCDISRPTYLKKNGGWGYVHLFERIVPAIRREVGDEAVRTMLVDNPARFLAFAETGQA